LSQRERGRGGEGESGRRGDGETGDGEMGRVGQTGELLQENLNLQSKIDKVVAGKPQCKI
jgi:hypothetical protein